MYNISCQKYGKYVASKNTQKVSCIDVFYFTFLLQNMALAEHLPVYKASYDMTLALFHIIKKYPKDMKYTLWEQLKKDSLALIATIYKANTLHEKQITIREARWYLQSVRVMLRLSKDLHVVWLEKFAFLQESIETISKQLTMWEKSCQKT